jgi:hypothetical protein
LVTYQGIDTASGGLSEEFIDSLARENAQPPACDLFIGPLGHDIGAGAEDDVHMVGEDGIGQYIDPEDRGQAFQSNPDPLTAGFVILSRDRIQACQKGTADTALDAVDDTDFVGIEQFGPQGSRHSESPRGSRVAERGRKGK